jgi:hypothetical protein
MKQHGRKSAASIAAAMAAPSVIAGGFGTAKAEPPEGMPERQAKIWRDVVRGEPAAFLRSATSQGLLQQYCRHTAIADEMAELLAEFPTEALIEAKGMHRYEWLAKMHRLESKAALEMATKLRLTNQSRWQPQSAAIAAEAESSERSPWDEAVAKKA